MSDLKVRPPESLGGFLTRKCGGFGCARDDRTFFMGDVGARPFEAQDELKVCPDEKRGHRCVVGSRWYGEVTRSRGTA